LKPGYAVILDSDDCHAIVAQKGLVHCRVQIFGKRAHGAYNWLGENAIEIATRVINRLKAHRFSFKKHPLLRPPTLNVGTIRGGDKVNMVADFCEFSLDIRFLRGMTHTRVLNEVRAIIRQETTRFKILIDDLQQPYDISPDHPLVHTYLQEARVLKIPGKVKGSEGATVMTFFRKHRIPAFATGFGTKGTAHTTDEYAKLSTLIKGARLLEQFLISFDKVVE
ncbi:MAG TPA: M20/M25/M40 family metallo-hydrolase, partial [Candidatus Bathyarchaeia archaeon]|nr:M20/M25/M40 family metallo-hydrolase [Candidatus Bathyarchaeia archaeon]